MRFHVGPVPHSPDFRSEEEGWTKLREPTPGMMQVIATPIAIGMAAFLVFAWNALTPLQSSSIHLTFRANAAVGSPWIIAATALGEVILGFGLLIAVHELLHAVTFPGCGLTPQTLIGVWPSRFLFYAAYLGPLSRTRFLWVFAVPLLVLTVAPLLVCIVFRTAHVGVAVISIVNGACACGDLLGIAMIVWQVPQGAVVRNQSWNTWWKMAT